MAGDARYSVGIDLGTTNSAVASADLTGEADGAVEVVSIPQLVEAGEVADRSLLPSFLYVAGEFDFPADSLQLPWRDAGAAQGGVGGLGGKGARRSGWAASWRESAAPRPRRVSSRRPNRGCRPPARAARRRSCR